MVSNLSEALTQSLRSLHFNKTLQESLGQASTLPEDLESNHLSLKGAVQCVFAQQAAFLIRKVLLIINKNKDVGHNLS